MFRVQGLVEGLEFEVWGVLRDVRALRDFRDT